jgi:hypothetical protein
MVKVTQLIKCQHNIHAFFPLHIPLASTSTSAGPNCGNNCGRIAGSSLRLFPIVFEVLGLIFVIISNVSIVVFAVFDAARGWIFLF